MTSQFIPITSELSGQTLAAILRKVLPGYSWKAVRQFVASRRVKIGSDLCLDPARRLREGESLEILSKPAPKRPHLQSITFRFVDEHLVVVEKPAGLSSVRHPSERNWSKKRRALSPTLDDLVAKKLAFQERRKPETVPRLRIVHRLDKETSGLLVFARTPEAERSLGKQFHTRTIHRQYWALIPDSLAPQTITSYFVRNRGDGLRGSTELENQGKIAITHIDKIEKLGQFSIIFCRLQTGRTHQIRIHLAEAGHPLCGEKLYNRSRLGEIIPDDSQAPRLALHAAELGFRHPTTGEDLFWQMELPPDLRGLV